MISKALLKELSGYKQQKNCDFDSVFVVEGVKMAEECLNSGAKVSAICATAEWLSLNENMISDQCCYEVSLAELQRLSNMRTPNEVWMLVERQQVVLKEVQPLVLALDHLQDPGNMGTILRTADWYGVRHVVCSDDTVSCYNPKVVQSTMGAVFRTRVDYCSLAEWLDECGRTVYGALLEGDNVDCVQVEMPAVLVIGNESRGISQAVVNKLTKGVKIANRGGTCESLNAAVAAGILLDRFLG